MVNIMDGFKVYTVVICTVLGIIWYGVQTRRKKNKAQISKPKVNKLTTEESARADFLARKMLQSGTGIQEAISVAQNKVISER